MRAKRYAFTTRSSEGHKTSGEHIRLTVCIINFHGGGQLESCLDGLASSSFTDWELLLVDNSPADGTVDALRSTEPLEAWLKDGKAKIITNERNLGFAKAANQGIAEANGEYVLLLNQDVIIGEDYISALLSVMESDEKVASATGKLLRPPVEGSPDVIDSTGHEFYDDRIVINRGKDEEDAGQYENPEEVFGVSAAAALYRISALKEAAFEGQVFDEDFFAYFEDVDLDFRLRRMGYRAWYVPGAVARHALAGSGGRKSFAIRFAAHTNMKKVIIKNDSFPLLMRDYFAILRQDLIDFMRTLFTSPLQLFAFFILPFKIPRLLRWRGFINGGAKVTFREIYKKWVRRGRSGKKIEAL